MGDGGFSLEWREEDLFCAVRFIPLEGPHQVFWWSPVEECAVIKNGDSVNKPAGKDRFMSLAAQASLHMLLTLDGERN